MVRTRSQTIGQHDNDDVHDINSPFNPQGPQGHPLREGTSGANPPTVPLGDYEALKKENEENRKMLTEIMAMLKDKTPQANVVLPPHAPARSRGVTREQRTLEEDQPLTHHLQAPEHQPPLYHPQLQEDKNDANLQGEGVTDQRRRKEPFQEVVESTYREIPKAPAKKVESDNQSLLSAKDMVDIHKIVEGILEQKKLVPSNEAHQEGVIPFTKEVMEKPLPPKFKMPQLPTFTRKEDHREHIQNYESIMLLHGWEDAIMCRAFSITLKDIARDWFYALKEASISCFSQLKKEFINTFIINSKRKKDATYLLSVRQKEGESLKQYIDRFRNATLEIHELQPGVAVAAMLQGTRSIQLQESLSLDQPTSLADLFSRANQYIRQAEMMKIVGSTDDRKRRDKYDQGEQSRKKERVEGLKGPQGLKFDKYTPLSQSRTSILAAIERSGLITLPPKADRVLGKDTEAFCKFHGTRGHSTEKCHQLMNRIETLVREGKLDRFTYVEVCRGDRSGYPRVGRENNERRNHDQRGNPGRRYNNDQRERGDEQREYDRRHQEGERRNERRAPTDDNAPVHPAINFISGGETMAGSTSSARKAYARQAYQVNSVMEVDEGEQPITFSPTDKGNIVLPQIMEVSIMKL